MSSETICLPKAPDHYHYPEAGAKSMVKRLFFLHKFYRLMCSWVELIGWFPKCLDESIFKITIFFTIFLRKFTVLCVLG